MVKKGLDLSQFADDSAFWKLVKCPQRAFFITQLALNVIEVWSKTWGFEISPEKSQVDLFNPKTNRYFKIMKTKIKWQRTGI